MHCVEIDGNVFVNVYSGKRAGKISVLLSNMRQPQACETCIPVKRRRVISPLYLEIGTQRNMRQVDDSLDAAMKCRCSIMRAK